MEEFGQLDKLARGEKEKEVMYPFPPPWDQQASAAINNIWRICLVIAVTKGRNWRCVKD